MEYEEYQKEVLKVLGEIRQGISMLLFTRETGEPAATIEDNTDEKVMTKTSYIKPAPEGTTVEESVYPLKKDDTDPRTHIFGVLVHETTKAYLVKRDDGKVAWVAKSNINSIMGDRIILEKDKAWIKDKMEWNEDTRR